MKKNMLILSLLIIGGFAGKAEARYMANIAQHKEYESIQRKDYPHDCELLFAAFMGDIKLVVSALQSGANIYALDADGYTSGYIALSRHNFDVAKWIEAQQNVLSLKETKKLQVAAVKNYQAIMDKVHSQKR